ncbi:MAG: class I SAM-dependent methyltransferase [Chloroflexi bacterium]|nr:class I SAM-dependent methyltransferase [Chloroflexota bacterium]
MAMSGNKITLTEEKETLFIPLYSKALESKQRQPILVDTKAEAILAQIDYDFQKLRVPKKSRVTLAMRAKKLDACVQAFLAQHAPALVLHLGCGLDSRIVRVNPPLVPWYDVDYPEVIELRRSFYQETDTYHMLGSSVVDFEWMEAVNSRGPAIIIAEGLLMYLHETQVKDLFLRLQQRFPNSEIAFDAFSTLTVSQIKRHPSIQKTRAEIHWGIDEPRDIEQWGSGIQLIEEWPFSASEDIAKLGWGEQIMFRVTGAIDMARRAHRILRYRL